MIKGFNYSESLNNLMIKRHSLQPKTLSYLHPQQPCQLDIQYCTLRVQILDSHFFKISTKHIQIRILSWLHELDKITINKTWKTNRNNYVKLLNLMCQCEQFVSPFNGMPNFQELPTIHKQSINQVIDQIQRKVKQTQRQTTIKMNHLTDIQSQCLSRTENKVQKISKSSEIQDIIKTVQKKHKRKRQIVNENSYVRKPKHQQNNQQLTLSKRLMSSIKQRYYSPCLISQKIKNETQKNKLKFPLAYQSQVGQSKLMERKSIAKDYLPHIKINLVLHQHSDNIKNGESEWMKPNEYWLQNNLQEKTTPKYLNNLNQLNNQLQQDILQSQQQTYRTQNYSQCDCYALIKENHCFGDNINETQTIK